MRTPAQRVERLAEAAFQQPRLPLAIAAGRPGSLQVAARYGEAWITYGDTTYLARYAALGFTDLVFRMPRIDDPVWKESPEIVEQLVKAFL